MKRVFAVRPVLLLAFLLSCETVANAQVWKKIIPGADSEARAEEDAAVVIQQLRRDINYLASDDMQGRRTGTNGEARAGMYIEKRMADVGLLPYGKNYRRPFRFDWGRDLTPETRMTIGGKFVFVPEDAFPTTFSAAGEEDNYFLPESRETHSAWVISLYDSEQEAKNPNFDWEREAFDKAKYAAELGATSVLLYDKYGAAKVPKYVPGVGSGQQLDIPVLVLSKKAYDQHLKDIRVMQPLAITIKYRKEYRTGTNIVGYINNGAAQTVVIGAHYDHLGYGEDGGSKMPANTAKAIHNGADDNASGVAAMIALARKIKEHSFATKKYNYLFVAFSAEELGLLGSKALLKEADIDKSKVAYMLNLDMVGRLSADKKLTVGGIGTSPVWNSVIPTVGSGFKIVRDSAGSGPSDHTSFYNEDIPVLFFFTGIHGDYHKPTDDAAKINYTGTKDIVNYVYGIVSAMEKQPVPLFASTANVSSTGVGSANFKVSMGFVPDQAYSGLGVKVESVQQDKAGAKAGLLAGDIVMQLGATKIYSMQSYYDAMSGFNPGDKTMVKVKRGATVQELKLSF